MVLLGKNLKKIRIKYNLSQEELAKKLNVHRTIISKWENDCLLPSIENMQMLAKIYGITIDEIINNNYSKKRKFKIIFFILIIIIFVIFFFFAFCHKIRMCKIFTCFFV